MGDNKKSCKHLYLRAILECMQCGQRMTNVNKVKRTLGNETYEFETERFVPYSFDSVNATDENWS